MADTGVTVWAAGFWADDVWAAGLWSSQAPVTVPDVVGNTQAIGTATLQGVGFVVVVATASSNAVPVGSIISQSPIGGSSANFGSIVTITVSLGDTQSSGGFWPDYEHVQRQRRKRQREIEEAEEETQRLKDETDREIAKLLHEQEQKDADRADLTRLQKLADQYATQAPAELPKLARIAILNAQDARTRNALEQMQRVIEQSLDEEMVAIQQVLLLLDS